MQEQETIPGTPDSKEYNKGKWILAEPMEQIEGPGSGAHRRIAGFDLAPWSGAEGSGILIALIRVPPAPREDGLHIQER